MSNELSLESIVVASPEQVSSDLAGETVLLSMTDAHYYGFAGVGSRIWELVQEPTRVAEIRATLMDEFDVSPERCEADLFGFLGALLAKQLIEVRVGG